MLAISTVPTSLLAVLQIVRPCFTAASYQTFTMLLVGMVAGPVDPGGGRTVTGMLKSACLSQAWSHDRVHTFFSRAAWDPARLGLLLAAAVADRFLPGGAPVLVVVDDTLFRRRGQHVWGAGWAHDGSARGRNKTGYGNTWVVAAIIVTLPFTARPIALPVTARMWRAGAGPSRCELALSMIHSLKRVFGERQVNVVADAAYHHREVAALPAGITWTTRLPANAALTGPTPEREPGRRGRPRKKGDRLGTLTQIAAGATWKRATVTKYGQAVTVRLAVLDVQWYGPWKDLPARLILLKEGSRYYDLALITTDPTVTAQQAVQNYAARWGIEVVFQPPDPTSAPARPATAPPEP